MKTETAQPTTVISQNRREAESVQMSLQTGQTAIAQTIQKIAGIITMSNGVTNQRSHITGVVPRATAFE